MVLVDTSVWIAVFRSADPLVLEDGVDFDEIVTCLPVVQEVLQGFREEREYRFARESMLSLAIVESPLGRDVFLETAELFRSARRQGTTVRASTDCLIGARAPRALRLSISRAVPPRRLLHVHCFSWFRLK